MGIVQRRISLTRWARALALPFSLCLPLPGAAQQLPSDAELLALVRSRVEEGRATGIVLGVLAADGRRRIVSFGDPGPGAHPLDAEAVFEIGSITKVFTGTLLAEMASTGEVSLDDPAQQYLPTGVPVAAGPGQVVRLVDLATHRSGLPRLPNNMAPADAANPYADYSVPHLYAFLGGFTPTRDVGAEYEYSNLAVGLLGHVLSLRAGKPYENLVRERILEPLGMSSTAITLSPSMQARTVRGHDEAGEVVPLWDIPTLAGAGALRSDMNDMLTFLEANVGEPTSGLERAMRLAHDPRAEAGGANQVGLNWHILTVGGDRIVWHNGGTAGFRTFIGFDPVRRVGAVVLTNSGQGNDDIGFHVINAAVPLAPAPRPPAERTEVTVDRTTLARYVGTYEIVPQFQIAVTLEPEGLALQATGQPKFPLFAESETAFFLKVVDAQITFVTEGAEVTALVLHQGGADQRARKVR